MVLRGGLPAAVGLLVLVGLGVLSTHSSKDALGAAAAVLCLGIALYELTVLPIVAVVGTLFLERVGGASTNLSVSDALLFVGTLSALPLFKAREDPDARFLLFLVAVYEAVVLVAVLDHPYRSDWVEWGHEAFLTAGSLILGWVVGRRDRARVALLAFLVGSAVLSAWAFAYSAAHHLRAANLPLGYQKNVIGDLVAFAVLVAAINPAILRLARRSRTFFIAAGLLGILGSGSRQAMVGLVVAMLVVLHRQGGLRRHLKVILLLAIPALVYVGLRVEAQIVSTNRFNSYHQRLSWYHDCLVLLHQSPWLGEGLRWWYTGRFNFAFQPPNAELEMLTSVGWLGTLAFAVLVLGALVRLRRLEWSYGTLAFAALLMRVVQGQFDVFWVAGQTAIPWMLVGIALGAQALARATPAGPEQEGQPERASQVPLALPSGAAALRG